MTTLFSVVGHAHTVNTAFSKNTPKQVIISIARDGTVSLAGKRCSKSQLTAKLKKLTSEQPAKCVIRAHADTPLKELITVLDSCKAANVQSIGIGT